MPVANVRAKVIALIAFTIVAGSAFAIFIVKSGVRVPLTARDYQVNVVLPDAATLVSNADVRSAGVIVGHVTSVTPTRDGQAEVKIALKDEIAPLAKDSRVRVRLKTVLGESYVAVQPGTGATGMVPDGGWLQSANVDDQVQLDQILGVFDGPTRARLREDLLALGGGLNGRGQDLNQAFAGLEATAVDGRPVTRLLADQRGELKRVISNTSELFDALDQRRDALQSVMRQIKTVAVAADARDREIAATIRRLPGTLRAVKGVAGALGRFGATATPVLADLDTGARRLRPTIDVLAPAARSTRRVLERLPRLVDRANPLLAELRSLSTTAPRLTTALPKLLCEINPALDYLAPYSRDTGAFMSNVAMVNDASDEIGRNPITVLPTVDLGSMRFSNSIAKETAGKLIDALKIPVYHPMRYNPFPKPGTIDNPQAWDGVVPRVPSTCAGAAR